MTADSLTVQSGKERSKPGMTLRLVSQPVNPLNAELNPIRHLLALVGDRHIVHVSRVRVNIFSGCGMSAGFSDNK